MNDTICTVLKVAPGQFTVITCQSLLPYQTLKDDFLRGESVTKITFTGQQSSGLHSQGLNTPAASLRVQIVLYPSTKSFPKLEEQLRLQARGYLQSGTMGSRRQGGFGTNVTNLFLSSTKFNSTTFDVSEAHEKSELTLFHKKGWKEAFHNILQFGK